MAGEASEDAAEDLVMTPPATHSTNLVTCPLLEQHAVQQSLGMEFASPGLPVDPGEVHCHDSIVEDSQILELLDFESPIPPEDRGKFLFSPETCFLASSGNSSPTAPIVDVVQNEDHQVELDSSNPCGSADVDAMGPIERGLFHLAHELAVESPVLNNTSTSSTFRRSPSSSSGGTVGSREMSPSQNACLTEYGVCQLNQGFEDSDTDIESCKSSAPQSSSSTTLESAPARVLEALNPFLERNTFSRHSMVVPATRFINENIIPERPKSASGFTYNVFQDEWQPCPAPEDGTTCSRKRNSAFSYEQINEEACFPGRGLSAPASPVTRRPALSRCKQRASMIVTSAKRCLSGRRLSTGYSNPLSDDEGDRPNGTVSPTRVQCAYDRSSVFEPRRPSLKPAGWVRPHSIGVFRNTNRVHSESCCSCGPDDIDWSWVQEEERRHQDQEARSTARAESPDVSSRERQCANGAGERPELEPENQQQDGSSSNRAVMPKGATPPSAAASALQTPAGEEASAASWSYQCDADAEDNDESLPGTPAPGVERPSSWLRASMRRVRHFRLGDPAPQSVLDRRSVPEVLPHLPPTTAAVLLSPTHSSVCVVNAPSGGRPTSAPASTGAGTPARQCGRAALRNLREAPSNHREALRLQRPNSRTRSNSTPGSLSASQTSVRASSTTSISSSSSSSRVSSPTASPNRSSARNTQNSSSNEDSDDRSCEDGGMSETSSPLGQWPHNLSSTLACLGCTVGLFNISRFAVLSVQFGANFIIQFLIVSAVFGIPLYTFQVCLGQYLAAGAVDMWRISPVFQGIGIALLVAQALIGVYSIVGVSWIFIYFRDSFITKQDRYRWAEPFDLYREDQRYAYNTTLRLEQTVPDYFNGVVLQRHNLATPDNSFGHIKFQVAFNLAVVWMIVFVSLSKGLRSYGKVVYVFSLLPVFGMLVLCVKMLGLMPRDAKHLPETEWTEFFINSKCWIAATTEAFLTWGLLGTAAMQIASHNKQKQLLQRDFRFVVLFTVTMLLLAACLANMCVALLLANGFIYKPSSFERRGSYEFLQQIDRYHHVSNTPVRWMPHTSFIMGERVTTPDSPGTINSQVNKSGYQVLRLATELVPSTLALLGADQVSPFWAVLFYFVLILFGIAQQLAIWHCVITGIMAINAQNLKSWETTITFFSCACGFILGLPMTTELGIFVVYFLDFCVGSGWWLMVLYLLQIGAVLIVRGRPYSGESIAATLFHKSHTCLMTWAAPLLTFTWNVILPGTLIVVCITMFKNGGSRDLYSWHMSFGYDYWPLWAREVGSLLQLLPIVIIPVVGVIQSCRYLSAGPPDLFDRIQLLYRPPLGSHNNLQDLSTQTDPPTSGDNAANSNGVDSNAVVEDPPPKYTPPPSYTTATGARIAKMLRQSFRRSVRRLQHAMGAMSGETSEESRQSSSTSRTRPSLPPPPDYAAVLVEMNQAINSTASSSSSREPSSVTDITIIITDNNNTESPGTHTTVNNYETPCGNNLGLKAKKTSDISRVDSHRTQPSSSGALSNEAITITRSSMRRSMNALRNNTIDRNRVSVSEGQSTSSSPLPM